ncbi:MAG: TetR/AcrR family transcriptional regulator [Nitrospirota bacterium]
MLSAKSDITRKGERTRQRIVETARVLFHARGYGNTSMDDIVRRSRVTKGNLYYYFASKEELGQAVLELTIAEQFESGAALEHNGPEEHIAAMFRRAEQALSDGRCKGGCLFGNLALEVSDSHDGLRRTLDQAFTAWERRVADLLAQGVRDGVFSRELEPRAAARFVVATLEGGILLAKVTREVDALRACAAMVARVLDGFRETSR